MIFWLIATKPTCILDILDVDDVTIDEKSGLDLVTGDFVTYEQHTYLMKKL